MILMEYKMTTTFNTGNPVGSTASKDLSDNASNFDDANLLISDTWQDRLGVTRDTVNGRIKKMGFAVPVAYASGIVFATNDNVKTVEEASVVYAPLPSALPFTTSGTFIGGDDAKFFVVQSLTNDQLINDLSQAYEFDTIDNMTNSSIQFPVSKVISVKQDNLSWDVVLSSSVIANGDNTRVSTGYPTNTFIARKSTVYDILITYGQSNSIGYAGQPGSAAADNASTPVPVVYAKNYDPVTDTILPISNTMNHLNYFLEGGGSRGNAWTAFANTWYELTGNGLVVLNAGRGGASISQLQKGNTSPVSTDPVGDADYYQRMLAGYTSTKAAMATQGYTQGGTYCVFHQGETDQQSGLNPVSYRNDLKQIALDMFTDFNNLAKFGVCIVGCPGSRALESWRTIQSAQYSAVNDGVGGDVLRNMNVVFDGAPSFTLENGQYNPQDDTHYSQRGYNEMGSVAARGLYDWAANNIDSTGNESNARNRRSVASNGFTVVNNVSAIASYDGSSWSLLTQSNTGVTSPFYPDFIKSITLTGGVLRFICSGISPVTYDMSVELNDAGVQNSLFPTITKYTGANEWGFDVTFRADLYFFVDTATGVILDKNPPTAPVTGSLIDLTVSATSDGTTATVTHPTTQSIPEIQYMATSAAEAGSVGMRVDATTTTRVTATGASSSAAMRVRRVALTRTQAEGIGAFAVRITAKVSDTQ
jgi:hypothetical protein